MQDKKNTYLVDKGWDSMQLILDKEMPHKKKRRLLIWWFLGAILVLLSFLLLLQNKWNSSDKLVVDKPAIINVTSQEDKQIAEKNEVATKEAGPDITLQQSESESQLTKVEEPLETTIAKELLTTTDKTKNSNLRSLNTNIETQLAQTTNEQSRKYKSTIEITATETPINNTAPVVNEDLISNNDGDYMPSKNENEAVLTDGKTSLLNENDALANQKNQWSPAVIEPVVEVTDIDDERQKLLFQALGTEKQFDLLAFSRDTKIIPQHYNEGSWYASIGGAILYNPQVKLTGLSANLDFGYGFDDRFDIGVSLGTGAFRYSNEVQELTAINVSGRMEVSEAEANNILRSSFENASYINFGMHGGLGITKRLTLRLDAGYKYLYTSMFSSDDQSFDSSAGIPEDVEIDTSGAGEFGGAGTSGDLEDFTFALDKRWFPYLGAGLSYRFSDRSSFELAYTHVNGELFQPSSTPLSMNRFRLGFRYRFYQSSKK